MNCALRKKNKGKKLNFSEEKEKELFQKKKRTKMLLKCEGYSSMFQVVCVFAFIANSSGETLQTISEEGWKTSEDTSPNAAESAGQSPYSANSFSPSTHLSPLTTSPYTSFRQPQNAIAYQSSEYLPHVVKPYPLYVNEKHSTVAFASPETHSFSPEIYSQQNTQPLVVPCMYFRVATNKIGNSDVEAKCMSCLCDLICQKSLLCDSLKFPLSFGATHVMC